MPKAAEKVLLEALAAARTSRQIHNDYALLNFVEGFIARDFPQISTALAEARLACRARKAARKS